MVKKKVLIFLIFVFMFISMPLNVKGEEYKICLYRKNNDETIQAALHVVGSSVVLDIYRSGDEGFLPFIFDNELEITHNVVNGSGVSNWPTGVNTAYRAPMDPKFLLHRCPSSLCEGSESDGVWLDEDGCSLATRTFTYVKEVKYSSLTRLDEALAYKYNGSNSGLVTYSTVLDGGCPSNVAAFKLAKSAYGILRIAAPVVLVLFASLDLGKAVIASDEGQIKKAQSHLMKRVAAGVIVFLVFVIIEMFVGMVSGSSDAMSCVNQFLN